MTLADFQQKTTDRIVEVFRSGQRRILLADEVGLGKTIVARAVIKQVGDWHRSELNDDHFKVVYICSNISIASQNAQKLGIKDQMNVSESRLSMQHLKIYQSAGVGHDYEQLIPLTPATSFSMTNGGGSISERALMFAHLWRLPAFDGYKEKLYRFLTYYATKGWPTNVEWYEKLVVDCDRNGSHYIDEMAAALESKLAEQPDLIPAIKAICDTGKQTQAGESQTLIKRLRLIFAEISLAKLDPDLVIMDEFQRFRDLIAPPKESEEKLLSQQFLQDTHTKVLLLSATPYKPYSTLEEIAEDESSDHYREFMEVMNFLFYDDRKRRSFQTVWRDYSASLSELKSDSLTLLVAQKNRAEDLLYQGVCRTERFNTGIIDDSGVKEVCVSAGDILSCDSMQTLLDAITKQNPKALHWRNVPIDYVKSSPYLLSFMENYQLKKQIRDYCAAHPEFSVKKNTSEQYLLLKKASIHSYRPVSANNARLETLKEIVFSDGKLGSEALLWMPPSRPYYYTGGVFYSDMAGGKYRMEMTAEEALAQIGLCGFASGLSAGDFQAVSIGENEEGDTKIEYVISPEKAVKIYGAAERMQRFALQGSAGGAVSFKETTGSVILDGSRPVSQSFSLPASIIFEDRAVAVTDSIYNEFEFFSDNIDMEFPSFSDFVKPAD